MSIMEEVTHVLVKGNLVDGYEGLPLCSESAMLVFIIVIQSQL